MYRGLHPIAKLPPSAQIYELAPVPIVVNPIYQTRCQPYANSEQKRNARNERNTMLHKAKTLHDYTLRGLDGEIGKAKEFYFDDRHWTIRYLVADTGNWLTGRHVLISPYALRAVSEEDRYIAVDLTKKQIEDSPPLDSDKPVSRQFEEAYYGYYGWAARLCGDLLGNLIPTLCATVKNGKTPFSKVKVHGIHICAALRM